MPPEEYWHSNERLKDWFASVRQRSKDRARGVSIEDEDEEQAGGYVDPDVANLR